jgi:hypothetical protein
MDARNDPFATFFRILLFRFIDETSESSPGTTADMCCCSSLLHSTQDKNAINSATHEIIKIKGDLNGTCRVMLVRLGCVVTVSVF